MHLQTRHASWEAHVHQLLVQPMLNAYVWHAAGSAAGASKDVTSARGAGCSGCSTAATRGPGYGCCPSCGEASSRKYVIGLSACQYKQACWLKSAGESSLDPLHMLVLGLRSMPPMSVAGGLLPQGSWITGGTLQTSSKTQQTSPIPGLQVCIPAARLGCISTLGLALLAPKGSASWFDMLYCLLQADNDMDIIRFALDTGEPMPPLRRWMELQLCTNPTLAGMQACLPPGDAPTCQLMP